MQNKAFLFKPKPTEYEQLKIFFSQFGGYTAFIKECLENYGYKNYEDLKSMSARVKQANLLDYEDFKGADLETID